MKRFLNEVEILSRKILKLPCPAGPVWRLVQATASFLTRMGSHVLWSCIVLMLGRSCKQTHVIHHHLLPGPVLLPDLLFLFLEKKGKNTQKARTSFQDTFDQEKGQKCNFRETSPLDLVDVIPFSPGFMCKLARKSPQDVEKIARFPGGEKGAESCHVCGCHGFSATTLIFFSLFFGQKARTTTQIKDFVCMPNP